MRVNLTYAPQHRCLVAVCVDRVVQLPGASETSLQRILVENQAIERAPDLLMTGVDAKTPGRCDEVAVVDRDGAPLLNLLEKRISKLVVTSHASS